MCRGLMCAMLVFGTVCFAAVAGFSVGELLGLSVKVELSDGQSLEGKVVGETQTTISIEVYASGEVMVVSRDTIAAIKLVDAPVGVQSGNRPLSQDPAFVEVKAAALKRVATWRLFRDGVDLAQTLVTVVIVQSQPNPPLNLILTWAGVGLSAIVVDVIWKPGLEERLLWQSQLPTWHGLVSLLGGLASLGGGISLVAGLVQDAAGMSLVGRSQDWFALSALFYLVQAGTIGLHMAYDAAMIVAP